MAEKLERLLEERVEYSTVTQLRESLLGVISQLGKHPAQRYLIMKHGKPQAVLVSFPTYEAFKAVLKYAWDQESAKDSKTATLDAIARMKSDYRAKGRPSGEAESADDSAGFPSAASSRAATGESSEAIHEVLEAIRENVGRLDNLLTEEGTRERLLQRAEEGGSNAQRKMRELGERAEELLGRDKEVVSRQEDQISAVVEAGKKAYRREKAKST